MLFMASCAENKEKTTSAHHGKLHLCVDGTSLSSSMAARFSDCPTIFTLNFLSVPITEFHLLLILLHSLL
ncbi:hypothetical protein V2J09_007748 [Rumex salicifolius]